jgi:hypothetical protein
MNRRCLARGKRPSRCETGEDEERYREYRTKRLVLATLEARLTALLAILEVSYWLLWSLYARSLNETTLEVR